MNIQKFIKYFSKIQKHKSTSIIKHELREKEFILYNFLFPNFFGTQLPINFLLLPLLPDIIDELNSIENKSSGNEDRIADIFEMIDL